VICAQAIRRAWLPTLFLLGLVGVPGCGGAAPPPSDIDAGAGPPRDGRIAFSAPAPGGEHIFTIDARGGSRLQLTTEGSTSKYPAWSMDGATTVFSSDRTGTFELWDDARRRHGANTDSDRAARRQSGPPTIAGRYDDRGA
jgi:hypothetical protein